MHHVSLSCARMMRSVVLTTHSFLDCRAVRSHLLSPIPAARAARCGRKLLLQPATYSKYLRPHLKIARHVASLNQVYNNSVEKKQIHPEPPI